MLLSSICLKFFNSLIESNNLEEAARLRPQKVEGDVETLEDIKVDGLFRSFRLTFCFLGLLLAIF